jgi:hypothetical protein
MVIKTRELENTKGKRKGTTRGRAGFQFRLRDYGLGTDGRKRSALSGRPACLKPELSHRLSSFVAQLKWLTAPEPGRGNTA